MLKKSYWIITVCLVLFYPSFLAGQNFVKIDDETNIELSLDILRKSIQQSDTTSFKSILSKQVKVNNSILLSKDELTLKMQNLFNLSSQRKLKSNKWSTVKSLEKNSSRNFWDFNIQNHKINIKDDTAYVICELILWGDITSLDSSAKLFDTLIFTSIKQNHEDIPEGTQKWEKGYYTKSVDIKHFSPWLLSGYSNLESFLENSFNLPVGN